MVVEAGASGPATPGGGGRPRRGGEGPPGFALAAKWIAALLLLVIGFVGVRNGIDDLRVAATGGQTIQALLSLASGALGLVACYAVGMGEAWTAPVLWAWAATITVMVAMAPAVWAGTGLGPVAAAGGGTAVIALLVIWLARVGRRSGGSEEASWES